MRALVAALLALDAYRAFAGGGPAQRAAAARAEGQPETTAELRAGLLAAGDRVTRDLPAFRGAQGGGAASRGGRGGKVYEITNLNDAGTGSLRACVEGSGPRTCVFRVSGSITLASSLRVTEPYLTIAGHTAPGGGVAVIGKNLGGRADDYGEDVFVIGTHDVTIRYIRVWIGRSPRHTWSQGFAVWEGSHSVILDHVSILWATDKAISLWVGSGGARGETYRDFTIQNSIIGESLAPHSTNVLFGGSDTPGYADGTTDIDAHHNYLPTGGWRNPLFKSRSGRFVNNVVYNWNGWAAQIGGGAYVDFIGNVYSRGPLTESTAPARHELGLFGPAPANNRTCSTGSPSVYLADNRGSWETTGTSNWSLVARAVAKEGFSVETGSATSLERRAALSSHTSWTSHGLTQDSSGTPIAVTPLVGDGSNLWRLIRPTVGASRRLDCLGRWVPNRDAADARVVSYYDRGGPRSQPSSEDDVGGFPTLAPGTPCADSDHDGLPDAYEDARGLDKNDPRDASAPTPSGFTNLDLYLDGPEDGESP